MAFELSPERKAVFEDLLPRYPTKKALTIPLLHLCQEQEGWISSEWKPSENNRRAKFYTLTRLGRKQLDQEAANWNRLSSAISQVMRLTET